MKNLTLVWICTALFASAQSGACEPTADQMEDYWQRSRKSEEAYLTNLAQNVDQILTGTVSDVTQLSDGPYAQLAHITVDATIKGHPDSFASAKMWLRVNPKRDSPTLDSIRSCDEPPDPAQYNPYVLKSYRYLYYIKDGVLLRVNGFPLGPPPLEPESEIELLKRAGV
ncbi:hypothetical protein [Luteimonas sp. MC1750]|uniref:hypothetical protein n=1 Tax=Luteimonas sp. MC1750 TaxID=2799326 RepID=UPI0018F0FBE8|nr:hypothetical protein [Luteimonas sp. MC1750]MBJ6985581.1 hypothetical protein [Luteimonas sp. MC1750]QQO05937.1 hypothetical protein JGR68_00270 [Luteimonas sp. MC1750]